MTHFLTHEQIVFREIIEVNFLVNLIYKIITIKFEKVNLTVNVLFYGT